MRVLGIVCSPRRNGNSNALVDEVLRGAAEGGAVTEKVNLNDLSILMCQACNWCKQGDGYVGCVLNDDMHLVHSKIIAAGAFALGCPIYSHGPAAQAKVFLDRCYSMAYREGGERMFKLAGKKMVLAFSYGEASPFKAGVQHAYGIFRDAFPAGIVNLTSVISASASGPGDVSKNPTVMDEAYRAGRSLADR